MSSSRSAASAGDPFDLDDRGPAWHAWRDRKLADLPRSVDDLVVEVRDPSALRASERDALRERCRRWNMAVYAGPARLPRACAAQPARLVIALGAALGLHRLDHNWLADDDGVSHLRDDPGAERRGDYVPYTNQPIRWHTDGYYNPPARAIHAMVLHCVERAESGGENRLIDHEIAWLLLRERDPAHLRALAAPDAMTIPARHERTAAACDQDATTPLVQARAAQTGPVFSRVHGRLHMRYTARTRSIAWKDDPATRAAEQALRELMATPGPHVLKLRAEPGMGLVCNNVLHDRSGFADTPVHRRWVLRARFHDRIG